MKITLIVGLPGSGKTYLASQLSGVMIDDIVSLDQLPNEDTIITDVNFCDDRILQKAMSILKDRYDNPTIEVIYFENDCLKARNNVSYRNDGRNVEGTIKRFSPIYKPPANARKIWQKE